MRMITMQSSVQPEAILYMALPNGMADVWLRKNITQVEDDEGNLIWEADEVYIRTDLSEDEVTASFDELFESDGVTEAVAEVTTVEITLEERVEALEEAFLELAEVTLGG